MVHQMKVLVLLLLCGALSAAANAQHCEDHPVTDPALVARAVSPLDYATKGGVPPNKITINVNGVTFDSNYDNGSLGGVTSGGANTFNCSLFVEQSTEGLGPRSYWFRFRMTGVAGRTITLNIPHGESPRPRIRMNDTDEWRVMTSAEAPNTSQTILTFGATENEAEVSFFDPLGYDETVTQVTDLVDASPWASMEVLGPSFQGRDVHLVTVTNPQVPDSEKFRVWLHSRAHAGEVTSTHNMMGFLKQITEESQIGHRLRSFCIFNIVPLVNTDGTALGHTRWDAQGRDPERQWCNPNAHPEVALLRTKVDEFMAGPNQIRVMLNLHSTQGNWTDTFFFKHVTPSVTLAFEGIQQDYIDAFDNATPLFDNLSAQSSQLAACRFVESYVWNNWQETVMAMTHEGHYRRRITDDDWITGTDYEELGRAQAVALIEYFNLPETEYNPPVALWSFN